MRRHELSRKLVCPFCAWRAPSLPTRLGLRSFASERPLPRTPARSSSIEDGDHWGHKIFRFAPRIDIQAEARAATARWRSRCRTRKEREDLPVDVYHDMLEEQINTLERIKGDRSFTERVGYFQAYPRHRQALDSWNNKMKASVAAWRNSPTLPRTLIRTRERKLYKKLRKAWLDGGIEEVQARLRFDIQASLISEDHGALGAPQDPSQDRLQSGLTDLRHPAEWYPEARSLNREIHLHIGPTNSGKTYQALQRLFKAKSGHYAGPLRLLAHEVYGRVLSEGRSCHLLTGDERIISEDENCSISSSTVEMCPLGLEIDVAVIDEIQLLGDVERGWAWTSAVLGLAAKELHLCGETRSLPLVRSLVALTGEKLIVHEYERLSPLRVADKSLEGSLDNVQPGDCLVAFSRAAIHRYVAALSNRIKGKVAVVYGSLPPDTRAEQARLFNDPTSGYDVIVASDAIGMGLNLNIRRIVFTSTSKFDGKNERRLEVSSVRQIGGRAGRFRVAPLRSLPNVRLDVQNPAEPRSEGEEPTNGLVTTLHEDELDFVRASMDKEPPELTKAGLKIPDEVIIWYASYHHPGVPLSYIMNKLYEIARTNQLFHFCGGDDILIADAIQSIRGLSVKDRLSICAAPAQPNEPESRRCLMELARCIRSRDGGELLKLHCMQLEVLDEPVRANVGYLKRLEALHKALTLYIWLSYRFPAVLVSQAVAQHARGLTELQISACLRALAEAGKINDVKKLNLRDVLEADTPELKEEDEDEDEYEGEGSAPEAQDYRSTEMSSGEETLDESKLRELVAEDLGQSDTGISSDSQADR